MSQVVTRRWYSSISVDERFLKDIVGNLKEEALKDKLRRSFETTARETIKDKWHRALLSVTPEEYCCEYVGDDFMRNRKTIALVGTVTYRR